MKEKWIAVGRLKRTRGNRGELIAEIYSSQPGRAEKLKEVMLEVEGHRRQVQIESLWQHDGRPIFKFTGIDSISDAEAWQGADILVPEMERAPLGEDEYSHADLVGCKVMAEGSGDPVGIVKGVEDYGSAPLLELEAEDGREILVPFATSICRDIDVEAKIIRVRLPEGLTELP